ncbi:MAG: stage V sporulation protein S [Caldilineaceae bacterium]|nr:stage V sporulation protein S [Caldilineaceae bacterium]
MAELIKVSAQSRSTAVAGAIAGVMREQGYAEVQAIGASAVNQAVKAIAIGAVAVTGVFLLGTVWFTSKSGESGSLCAMPVRGGCRGSGRAI